MTIKKDNSFKLLSLILLIILLIFFFSKLCILVTVFLDYITKKQLFSNNNNSISIVESMSNLEHSIFEPSGNTANSLGNIFKRSELNLKAYPNAEISSAASLFQTNKFLPECCFYYSQYSTDKGCPCITQEQQYYLQRRGTNKDPSSFIQERRDYRNLFFSPSMALKGIKNPFIINNVYFKRDQEPPSDISLNEFYSLVNRNSYLIEGKA